MPATNLPIPAENAAINRGELYQLTGLQEGTRYKFEVTSTKRAFVTIAEDEQLKKVQAEGFLDGTAYHFSTEGSQTSAYLRIDALEGAEIVLNMKADPVPAPEGAQLPEDLSPDKWYSVENLTENTLYELKVSADAPVTVFVKTGDQIISAIEEPPFTTQEGSVRFYATGTNAWIYVDGAVPANVALVPATGIEGFTKPQITALSSTVTAVSLMGPAPAGYYSVEFVTHADDLSFKQDQVLTVVSQNVAFSLLNSVASDGQTMQPAYLANSEFTGKDVRGKIVFSQTTPLGEGQSAQVLTITPPTGGNAQQYSGTAIITFAGNIA